MISAEVKKQLSSICQGPIFFDEPLARLTTIRVGGPADALLHPTSIEELQAILELARANKQPVFIFGGGSNLLVRDGGIRGFVINLSRGFQKIEPMSEEADSVLLRVEAGVTMPALLQYLTEHALTGLEYMAGIPATLGGAIWMNAGTPEGEIGDCVVNVTILDKKGQIRSLDRKSCGFRYRANGLPSGAIVLDATFKLTKGAIESIRSKIESHKDHRIETQPLNRPNLGSVFKNPPKQRAGRLIEEAGLKDVRVGQARISAKHGNFIINEGNARARDVLALIRLVKDKVKEKYQVRLETEVRVVGQDDETR